MLLASFCGGHRPPPEMEEEQPPHRQGWNTRRTTLEHSVHPRGSRSLIFLSGRLRLPRFRVVQDNISLSFRALGVNDVIAAVVYVLLTEYATRFYYSRPKVTFPLALLNNFKMGFTYGLFIGAFKFASG